ncbi:GNAT family N-acetyltransferase [Flagellimonas sp. GZD32]|uniref:GNAT family N-acetyltransferase n=1 Tax=Flagellimonas cixiensis TaxID=3228750 RepID=UPI0035C92E8A
MIIRKANVNDSKAIAEILMLVMDTIIFEFIGDDSMEKAKSFLESWVSKKANQYSYQNCWVADSGEAIVGVVNVYDGTDYQRLRVPIMAEISTRFHTNITLENETENGEIYIDSIGVSPEFQGKGIGSKLLNYLIGAYAHKHRTTIGLLVDVDNFGAHRLYQRLGFVKVGDKVFCGKKMEHLQLKF